MTATELLHQREEVATSDADHPISRYRVPGGWLYHALTLDEPRGVIVACALCFVPDAALSPPKESK